MWKLVFFIFLSLLLIGYVVPNILLIDNHNDSIIIERTLNSASKILIDSYDKKITNIDALAEGYEKVNIDIEIDKDRLLKQFYEITKGTIADDDLYTEIIENIKTKMLVYEDKFFISYNEDSWGPPYFFTYKYNDKIYYLNTKNDNVYYYNGNNKVYDTIGDIGLSNIQKDYIIIDKINEYIKKYLDEGSFEIKIKNEHDFKEGYQYFNVLDGLTFFVIYKEDNLIDIWDRINYKKYNVAGYTLSNY